MTIAAIVQARAGSTRLPEKVLREVEGKPLLQYLVERLARARLLDSVVVATSNDPTDDPVAALCEKLGLDHERGALDDVAGRLLRVAERRGLQAFARISGDSPLLDQRLVDQAVDLLVTDGCDLTTNVFPRSFPPGQSVEVLATEAFRRGYELMTDPDDLEHVTPFFYRHAADFTIRTITAPEGMPNVRLAVDTSQDLAAFARLVRRMNRPHWSYSLEEIAELAMHDDPASPAPEM
jgi:spore coat polysaccharide biosynthesis protein SpsF